MTLHDRFDSRLLDKMAQPHKHREAKNGGKADPSRLREVQAKPVRAHYRAEQKDDTHRDGPRHVMLAHEGDHIQALRAVRDTHERPRGGKNPIWEDVSEGARERPELGCRVRRHARAVDQEEKKGGGNPDLEGHLEVRDLRGFDLYIYSTSRI